jgi:hypothetical protein
MNLCHEPLGQETSAFRRSAAFAFADAACSNRALVPLLKSQSRKRKLALRTCGQEMPLRSFAVLNAGSRRRLGLFEMAVQRFPCAYQILRPARQQRGVIAPVYPERPLPGTVPPRKNVVARWAQRAGPSIPHAASNRFTLAASFRYSARRGCGPRRYLQCL